MARRKTKNQKIALKRRRHAKQVIMDAENAKLELIQKQEEILRNSKKIKQVRKALFFKTSMKFVYPYLLAMVGVQLPVLLFQGGFPFVQDDYKVYKEKTIESLYDGDVNYCEQYVTIYWWEDKNSPNTLKITTPWRVSEDGVKRRVIRLYSINYSDELADSLLKSDYISLERLLGKYSSEIVETTTDSNTFDDGYHVEGCLGTIEMDSYIKVLESERNNGLITGFEVSIFIVVCMAILKLRKFRLKEALKSINEEYFEEQEKLKINYDDLTQSIHEIEQKILAIKK